ncbi:MAG: hypothetical protein EXS55_00060 [Candidatus Magasanikbacteria bacterium]|nr:hypothetical protein [Candidatus Magasanikbacteria bacterium]
MSKRLGGEGSRDSVSPKEIRPQTFTSPEQNIIYYPESFSGCKAQPGDLVQSRDDVKPWRFMGRVGENPGSALLVDDITRAHRLVNPTLLRRARVIHEAE